MSAQKISQIAGALPARLFDDKQPDMLPAARQLRRLYPAIENFAASYSPRHVELVAAKWCEAIVRPDVPTLNVLKSAYGLIETASWIAVLLSDLNSKYGGADKMEQAQIEDVAQVIAANYGHLKATELMVFLSRFKAGMYERFYGRMDPMVITNSLKSYNDNRLRDMDTALRREAEANREREQWLREHIKMTRAQFKANARYLHRMPTDVCAVYWSQYEAQEDVELYIPCQYFDYGMLYDEHEASLMSKFSPELQAQWRREAAREEAKAARIRKMAASAEANAQAKSIAARLEAERQKREKEQEG